MKTLLSEIKSCNVCKTNLPLGAKPIISAHQKSKIALVSQAPGIIAHRSGTAWNDPGGKRLKQWLHIDDHQFYNPKNFAIVPIGFCYPGKGTGGDLPPRPECAPLWHSTLFEKMKELQLIILIGQYAQKYYLKNSVKKTVTTTVQSYKEYLPLYFPIPHPSPRNRTWMSKNPWFEERVIPELKNSVASILSEKNI
ncbi:uracil-DNA glycosylase family protein [Aquimarina addita]|uniref:Uracil-DNA glycosylase family protein n=1 Tax=Aquimarina addita TaxID=870485 RepID=A0ABP6USI5_9FLAO